MEQDFMGLRTVKVKKEVPEETAEPGILFELCLSFNQMILRFVTQNIYRLKERRTGSQLRKTHLSKCLKESTLKKAHKKNFMLFCQETKIVRGFSRFSYVLVYVCILQYFQLLKTVGI